MSASPKSQPPRIHVVNVPPLAPDDLPPLTTDFLPEDFLMNAAEMDGDSCPPDMIVARGDREAWVYDHGDIADLVFVRIS